MICNTFIERKTNMKKQRILIITLLIASIFILSACQVFPWFSVVRGSGTLTTESRPVSGFNAVQLDGAGRLVITQGTSESLEIQADDNLIGNLTSEVQGNTLILGYREQSWRRTILPSRPVVYTLTVTNLTQLTLNGAGDLEILSLETDSFDLAINGAGNIGIKDLSAGKLSVNLAGTGSVTVTGMVAEQSVSLDGAGNYQAGDLQTYNTAIEINGLGNGVVWATESLQVGINGGGSVSYYGSPNVSQQISGLGEVKNLGEK
jgi:hypothetical protein